MRKLLALVAIGALAWFAVPASSHVSGDCDAGQSYTHFGVDETGTDNDECVSENHIGPDENNTWYMQGGEDKAFGDGGADWIFGGQQADDLYGGSGPDLLAGDAGGDYLDEGGGSGCGNSQDQLDGDAGNDNLAGGCGSDILIGGSGSGDSLSHIHDGCSDSITGIENHFHVSYSPNNC